MKQLLRLIILGLTLLTFASAQSQPDRSQLASGVEEKCNHEAIQWDQSAANLANIEYPLLIPVSDGFDYPIGGSGYATQASDGDGWYNAQDHTVNNHLGEDWNGESGGNTDCGAAIYAASAGTIVYAAHAGSGWGNVIIVRHELPDGSEVETMYGHLESMWRTTGDVSKGEQIGVFGDADGFYFCHLHFELRLPGCPDWGQPGPGYSGNPAGWTDPSDYVDSHRVLGNGSGFASVSIGVNISPDPVTLGENFTASFTLQETGGASITFEEVGCAILDINGNHLFDLPISSNVTVPANGTWSYSQTGNIFTTNPPGAYRAVARGRVSGGNWFDFSITGSGVNPKFFQANEASGFASVSVGMTVSPDPVTLGENFTAGFTLQETAGAAITFAEVSCAILDGSGNHIFDLPLQNNVTVPANGTWSYSETGNIFTTNPPGTYQAMARGRVTGGAWFDFSTTGGGENPRSFQAIESVGFASVSQGVTVTPASIFEGDNFDVSFTLQETAGAPITFTEITVSILDENDVFQFDLSTYSNITVAANGTWVYPQSTGVLNPAGDYKAVARGRITDWFDFSETGAGTNPGTFQILAAAAPANISVSPSVFDLTVFEGAMTSATLTISNSGEEALTWTLSLDAACDWLTSDISGGSVSENGSQNVQLDIDATNLNAGIFSCDVDVSSNDPDTPLLTVPINLTVIPAVSGSASISQGVVVIPATIFEGDNFDVTFTLLETTGSAVTYAEIKVSIYDENDNFVSDLASFSDITISANSSWTYPASAGVINTAGIYTAMARGFSGGWIDFPTTGNGVNPAVFGVLSIGLAPPDISISPASLGFTVVEGAADSDILTISNSGEENLFWDLTIETNPLTNEGANILYDQSDNTTANAVISLDFESGMDTFDCGGADDFLVPSGEEWTIDQVIAYGQYSTGSGPTTLAHVKFFADNSGLPAVAPFYTAFDQAAADDGVGNLTIVLDTPAVLGAGAWWVSIVAVQEPASGNQWSWTERSIQSSNASAWLNPGAGFGTSCTAWGQRVTDCGIGLDPDLAFSVCGQKSGGSGGCDWLSVDLASGSVSENGMQDVLVSVDATNLLEGMYACNLVISSNDPDTPSLSVPVNLDVESSGGGGIPCADINTFQARCRPGGLLQMRIIVSNGVHIGEPVEFTIDGSTVLSTTVGANLQAKQSATGYSPGTHTIAVSNPAGCYDPVTVNCPALFAGSSVSGDFLAIPVETSLAGNFPNPFNPTTTIEYGLSEDTHAKIAIYNMLGQEIATVIDQFQTAGYKSVEWDGRNENGQRVASGIYIYRMSAGEYVKTQKMHLAK